MAFLDKSTLNERVLNPTDLRDCGDPQGQSNCPGSLDDIGLGDHVLHGDIGCGIETGFLSQVIDLRLICCIGLCTAVPIKVIGVDIQTHRSQRRNSRYGMQLEGGELDSEDGCIGINGFANGKANIAYFDGVLTCCSQHRSQHSNRRRLAIGSSNA